MILGRKSKLLSVKCSNFLKSSFVMAILKPLKIWKIEAFTLTLKQSKWIRLFQRHDEGFLLAECGRSRYAKIADEALQGNEVGRFVWFLNEFLSQTGRSLPICGILAFGSSSEGRREDRQSLHQSIPGRDHRKLWELFFLQNFFWIFFSFFTIGVHSFLAALF